MTRERKRTQFAATALLIASLGAAAATGAQRTPTDSAGERRAPILRPGELAVGGLTLLAAAAADERVRHWAVSHRASDLERAADAGNVIGRGRVVMTGMAVAYVGARLARRPRVARAVVRSAVAYTVGNAAVSALKSAVGRHRPEGTDEAWRFRPFRREDEWHSFSSSHVVHVATVAASAADAARKPWVTTAAFAAVGLVGFSRVYSDEHWTSDAAASAVIGVLSARLARGIVPDQRPRR